MQKYIILLAVALFSATAACAEETHAATSLVSTTDAGHGWAVNYPKQRKVFVMAGLLWVFYSDGANGVYRTSANGEAWSEAVPFGEDGHFGHRFGGWFDGTYFHYTLCTAGLGAEVRYRRGLPEADGAIAWTTEEQRAYDTPPDKNVMYPKIIVDSEGCPWITFMELVYQEPNTPPYDAVVIKASSNDGAWKTAEGFPFLLVNQKPVAGYPDPVGVPLTGGKTAWIYNPHRDGVDVYAARIWTGCAWEEEEIVVRPAPIYSFFNAVADGDDIHLIHGAGIIHYQKRIGADGWSEPEVVSNNASGHTAITLSGTGDVIVTWLDTANNRLCYRERIAGEWKAEVPWTSEASPFPGAGINLNTLVSSGAPFRHVAVYSTGGSAPFNIKAAVLMIPD